MAHNVYFGKENGIATQAADLLIGSGSGKALRIKKAYIGNQNGIAKLIYDNTPVKLIVRPYARFGGVYPVSSWDSNIANHGSITYYTSSNYITQSCTRNHQVISYHQLLFLMADGREVDIAHFCHTNNKTVTISVTDYVYYGGSGSGGWNAHIDDIGCMPDTWGTANTTVTIPPTHTTQSLYNIGTVYGSFLYLSSYSVSTGSLTTNNRFTFNTCAITSGGTSTTVPIEIRPWKKDASWSMNSGETPYSFNLGGVVNPDPLSYYGVYESNNKGIQSSYAVSKITFTGYYQFTIYIRSYAETTTDYLMVSTLDATSYPTSYSSAYDHTRSRQSSGTAITDYRKVTYDTDGGTHSIYVVYRKDGSVDSGDDKGYFLIPK